MKTYSIIKELEAYLMDLVNDGVLNLDSRDDWHYHAFNEDYYIISEYNARKWLEKHGIDAFEAISYCLERERKEFGECHTTFDSAETTVNHLVYWLGYEALANIEDEIVTKLEAI